MTDQSAAQPKYDTSTIAERRRARGLTQMQLCALLGCTIDTVRRWENFRGNPGEKYQELLDQVLGPAVAETAETQGQEPC